MTGFTRGRLARTTGISSVTKESIRRDLEIEVDESYVVLAKHSVMGTPDDAILQVLDIDSATLEQWRADPLYLQVRGFIAGQYMKQTATTPAAWDELELLSIQGLVEHAKGTSDPDFLLKAAAVSNRAVRKAPQNHGVLDPRESNGQVVLTLTKRTIARLSSGGEVAQELKAEIKPTSFSDLESLVKIHVNTPGQGQLPADSDDVEQTILGAIERKK